ncbi:nitric oxide reductase activation protein NorD [Sulfuritalea hydrogenivorans]|jgi:nitric oxide reductase NorD protein|uniref:Rubisco activation protein cbbO n=1 Tax=Sulfuritalea hydrogenivorans sk43H TaxID=1223802 RepID=W0SBH7_9PROT|nr:VWA domain-containing protein [Sulfuritalea hydrogenivorans]MDK9716182.1 VWA domain-containing protein [Sulfuritalea sp.]BAO28569.1 rubisco activation protein cbbO [Sulfuritalea hydrogenivorans sk43H]
MADARKRQMTHPQVQACWVAMDCGFAQVADVFEECVYEALSTFRKEEVDAYIETARLLGKMGRGAEPVLAFLEEWPSVANAVGADVLPAVTDFIRAMQKSPNSQAITPFLQTLAAAARRLQSREQLHFYIGIARELMTRTTGSIHGHHSTFPSPGLPEFFKQAPLLLKLLSMAGLQNWTNYGIANYAGHPERQEEYFSLQLADSRAVLQRERHGTLFADVERSLAFYLRALWDDSEHLVPYSTAFDELRQPIPYYDKLGMRVPDVLDDADRKGGTVSGLDRYRAVLAHMVGHRRWSVAQVADNWSPFQRMAVEFFEDCRVETLLIREYPGLRRIFLALHPHPVADACDPATTSCLRHRLAMLSRAFLDPAHGYSDPVLLDFAGRFQALLATGTSSTAEIAALALSWVAKTRRQSDQLAKVHFDDTVVDYRDDNRQLWKFIEAGDEEEAFDQERKIEPGEELKGLPPRHYPEWDSGSQTYRPDWVSVYEALHAAGNAADIDRLLAKHAALARQLKRLLDLLKPQDKVRIRYQEEGSELDLDVAIRSLIDFKGGATPDPRINMSHTTCGRDITVLLLLDLSESLNQKVGAGGTAGQTILELSQEAVSLLAWAIDCLGDPCAIAGFRSNTRHEVRYQHIKGFSERWDDTVKARLAAMEAGWSTRMGAALRHAGHYLAPRQTAKKILLLLTDGEPADIDVAEPQHLRADAKKAVGELAAQGITTFCLSLDPKADDYVRDIFGNNWRVLDRIERLPETLPSLYLELTR